MVDRRLDRVWLLAFGDRRLERPRQRLRRQALAFGLRSDHVLILDEGDLSPEFRKEFEARLVPGTRGYGYWCWKPEICRRTLQSIPVGDILLYLDIGCHLRRQGKARFLDYLQIVEREGFLAAQYKSLLGDDKPDPVNHFNTMAEFTKGDMLDYYGVRSDKELLRTGQVLSGIVFLKQSPESVALCEEWQRIYRDDFSLIDDSPSRTPNEFPNCRHRHDQSALSILWLRRRLPTFSACEIEPCRRWAVIPDSARRNRAWGHTYFFQMGRFPIWARRDKGLIPLHVRVWRHAWAYYLKPFFAKLRK